MIDVIGLEGSWRLQLDEGKQGLRRPLGDTMALPGTTSFARKGKRNEEALIGSLTDEYKFEGYAWFEREIDIPERLGGKTCFLHLERTRVTTVWIDGREVGTRNSLNTPHLYDVTAFLASGRHTITIRVDNTDYPTKGGHMTSPDTQTNWNGITGKIELQFHDRVYLRKLRVYPNVSDRSVRIVSELVGDAAGVHAVVSAASFNGGDSRHEAEERTYALESQELTIDYPLGEEALLWSDAEPNLYRLRVSLQGADGEKLGAEELTVGLREFKAAGDKFTINGAKTFLRGKHDGLIFPLTGFAPTDVEEWERILRIAKSYGMNHYRFHTCCPPEAAFEAADRVGIYMEPELPFWGTITDESDERHNQAEQDYLVSEGFAMLEAFGNHPSFVMMSLGNELWGSKTRISEILQAYKAFDARPLYTQGSNNFQWVPVILEEEDFFCGVRMSRERLFRGSYAMCDAPQGHVQVDPPSTMKDYDEALFPSSAGAGPGASGEAGEIQIQYGTEARTVQAEAADDQLIPSVPVVSHEIGQYATFPDFREIEKYTGPLKARNFEIFRERLEAKGLGHLAERYFECSGKLAADCYKEELEAAFRTKHLAGFQLLDLQDFSGQGTALVGMLDAFMDSKGLISPEEWRTFCSDAVLLARFEKFNYEAGETFEAGVELVYYRQTPVDGLRLQWELNDGQSRIAEGETEIAAASGETNIDIGRIGLTLPSVTAMTRLELLLSIPGTDIRKSYSLWVYPSAQEKLDLTGAPLFTELTDEAVRLLEQGAGIILLPKPDTISKSIEGTYATDFWCYPMFRSISESMNRPVPVGTMGLLIENTHPVFKDFLSEEHSTYPWWSIVMNSRSVILDDVAPSLNPIVQTIDNFERNHKLGLLSECRVGNGRVLFGALDADSLMSTLEGRQLLRSMIGYAKSGEFAPDASLTLDELRQLLG
ncbi:sugar-binding domain-containing protein [Paenibacillus soyae]|uniref:beta-galactosidase n=1 Tax=Paenibacillus soyae TaxID=2969249 RepID=A0A9X2MPD9_9BACL|nr:sugar-binding domain-containing protein [Paenibacillus soyae]MCR2805753.1 beta-glucuronidase [Paenibacillus soyae]